MSFQSDALYWATELISDNTNEVENRLAPALLGSVNGLLNFAWIYVRVECYVLAIDLVYDTLCTLTKSVFIRLEDDMTDKNY